MWFIRQKSVFFAEKTLQNVTWHQVCHFKNCRCLLCGNSPYTFSANVYFWQTLPFFIDSVIYECRQSTPSPFIRPKVMTLLIPDSIEHPLITVSGSSRQNSPDFCPLNNRVFEIFENPIWLQKERILKNPTLWHVAIIINGT